MKLKHFIMLAIALIACYDSSYALNRLQVRQRVRMLWGEFVSTNSYYPDSVLNLAISDAEYKIAHFGKVLEKDTVINLLSQTEYYNLPADMDGYVALFKHGKTDPQVMATFVPIEGLSSGITSPKIPVQQFSIYDDKLFVYPLPTSDGDSLRLLYYAFPTVMSSDTSTCVLGEYWSRLVPIITNDLIRLKDMPAENIIQVIRPKIEDYRRNYISGGGTK